MAAAAKNVYDNDDEKAQLEEWFGDCRAHTCMCDALARALRVRHAVMDYVYVTRLELPFPHDSSFTSLDAYIDATRDALVRALRTYEAEAEECQHALRARRLAELQRQQKAAKRAVDTAHRLPSSLLASGASRRRQAHVRRSF
jgi:hypothetical protein